MKKTRVSATGSTKQSTGRACQLTAGVTFIRWYDCINWRHPRYSVSENEDPINVLKFSHHDSSTRRDGRHWRRRRVTSDVTVHQHNSQKTVTEHLSKKNHTRPKYLFYLISAISTVKEQITHVHHRYFINSEELPTNEFHHAWTERERLIKVHNH